MVGLISRHFYCEMRNKTMSFSARACFFTPYAVLLCKMLRFARGLDRRMVRKLCSVSATLPLVLKQAHTGRGILGALGGGLPVMGTRFCCLLEKTDRNLGSDCSEGVGLHCGFYLPHALVDEEKYFFWHPEYCFYGLIYGEVCMNTSDFADLKLFITGPTLIPDEVRQAALLPEFGHRDSENEKRCLPIFSHLRTLAGAAEDYDICLINGSGSTALEATVRSLVADDDVVLNISVGAFGDLFHGIAVDNGKQAVQLRFANGRAMEEKQVRAALEKHRPAVVTMTHNETSTGVTNDIATMCQLVREYGALPLVDGVSIFGGVDIGLETVRPAVYVSATQKCLALPAGFGIVVVSAEALAKAKTVTGRGRCSDLVRHVEIARKHQLLTTPNTTLLNQMAVQLERIVLKEGVANRFARHEAMRAMVHHWVEEQQGFELFAQQGFRSPVLTTVQVPQGFSLEALKELKERLRQQGYLFDPGYGKLNRQMWDAGQQPIFRIGHMGDITPDMLAQYLAVLEQELARM